MPKGGWRWSVGRPGSKGKVEDCLRLDVRRMRSAGLLQPGYVGGWQWTDTKTGNPTSTVGISFEEGVVTLTYVVNGKPHQQLVRLDHTACHLGNSRPWFFCPVGGERVALLYFQSRQFACRRCQHLAYRSQSEDFTGRGWRRQLKAEAKLGANWARPKGMHGRTRTRLMEKIFECEMEREEVLDLAMQRHALGLSLTDPRQKRRRMPPGWLETSK
jgi:hypothetical protein